MSSQSYQLEYDEDFGAPLTAILTICMMVSIMEIGCFVAKLKLEVKLQIYRKRAHADSKILNLFKLADLIPEILFIAIHPSPFLVGIKVWGYEPSIHNYFYYHVNDFLTIIMSLKWVYITTLLACQTEFATARCNRVCHMFGAECDTVFIIKCLLKQSPFKYVFCCFVMGISVCGWILMIAESPLDRIHSGYTPHTFINSCWASICTMTTVGFGDIFPRTILGRFTAFSCAVFGMGIVSLLVVTFTSFLQMNSPQASSFTVIKRLQIRDLIKEVSGRLLITINKKSDRDNIDLEFARYSEIKKLINTFRG